MFSLNLEFLNLLYSTHFDLLLFHDFWISCLRIVNSDLGGEVKFPHHRLKGHIQFCQTMEKLTILHKTISSNFAEIYNDKRLWIMPFSQTLHSRWSSREVNLVTFPLLIPVDSQHLLKTKVWVPRLVQAVDAEDAPCFLLTNVIQKKCRLFSSFWGKER